MKYPKRKFLGKTWVGWLNIILLQWFFVRLAYGSGWFLLYYIWPLTGWWNDFKYLWRPKRVPDAAAIPKPKNLVFFWDYTHGRSRREDQN